MKLVVSLDIHRDFSKAVVMNQQFDIVAEERISHSEHRYLDEFFSRFERGTDVVMEATFNWPWIADVAAARGLSVRLANPVAARRLAAGMPKSDRRDAIWLARLWLSGDLFPGCYVASPADRRRRSLFRQRLLQVRIRTALKNAVHGQLFRLGHRLSAQVSDLFGRAGRQLLKCLALPEHERLLLDDKLALLDEISAHIEALQQRICAELRDHRDASLLLSIPGVGRIVAYTFLAEIGDASRFPNGRALASYAGLLPLANESADRDRGRRCSARCNRFLRWAALEAVTGAVRGSARMLSLHSRVKARNRGKAGKARVAVARQILEISWLLLTRGEPYQENPPARGGRRHPNRASQTTLSA